MSRRRHIEFYEERVDSKEIIPVAGQAPVTSMTCSM